MSAKVVVRKRKTADVEVRLPFNGNENISYFDNLDFEKDNIKIGDKIRFKNRRGLFTFRGLYHNTERDVTWIDCFEDKTGHMRAFYVSELKSVVRPKKSRAKKIV
jgi:hypothetical protein